jgi:hypothetical protein
MAQTSQSEETGDAGETTPPGAGRPQGLFGSSTTILLLILAVAVFWWNRRRRLEIEQRLRTERREAEAAAERSALDVAHLMRAGSKPPSAAAASGEPASAARAPSSRVPQPPAGATVDAQSVGQEKSPEFGQMPVGGGQQEAQALAIERAEARAAAERAAEEQAERASRDAETAGESPVRRAAAATAAAEEAAADTADAERVTQTAAVPAGAVTGNGTANCPPDYPIKGNRQSRIYHSPGQVSYPSTIAEYCFASAEAAERAGFRMSRARGQRSQK